MTNIIRNIKSAQNSWTKGEHPISPRIINRETLAQYLENVLRYGEIETVLTLSDISGKILTGEIHPAILSDVLTDYYGRLEKHRQMIETNPDGYYAWRKYEAYYSGSKEKR